MGATGIEWTRNRQGTPGYSFNPFIGCSKVSPACDFCYAEGAAKKMDVQWGPHADRRQLADSTWAAPLAWNRKAGRLGERLRVFSGSMCDILDNHRSIPDATRWRLWQLVDETPNLDWLFLTKRPQNAVRFLPRPWREGTWPTNVWMGITAENQEELDRRWPYLRDLPAYIRFMSCEPLLSKLRLPWDMQERMDWIIAGGESGRYDQIRDTPIAWFDDLRLESQSLNIPYFQKQLAQVSAGASYKKFDLFPQQLRLREQPRAAA